MLRKKLNPLLLINLPHMSSLKLVNIVDSYFAETIELGTT